jgi:nitronate monooxygenase
MPMTLARTPACDLLGCDAPIVLAGMGGPARAELVAAVSEAGGFGFLGMVRESPRRIAREIAAVRAATSRPFGVNLIPAATDRDLLEAELAVCLEARIHAVTLFWDLDAAIVRRLREAGIVVVCQIGSADEAAATLEAGADMLVAQGCEAGGHVRGTTPLRTLLPEVLAIANRPVLAAGGMTDGSDLAWALQAGAAGVLMGTAFLATQESFAHDYHKQRIVEAKAGDTRLTDVFHINWPRGAAVRVLDNSVTRGERGDPFDPANAVEIAKEERRPIVLFSTDSPLRTTSGDLEAMALYAGEGAGRIAAIPTAGDLLRAVAAQAEAILEKTTTAAAKPQNPSQASADAIGRSDLVAALEELLLAERAGARVAAQTATEVGEGKAGGLLRQVQRDEARWCAMLLASLHRLGASPSTEVGAFHGKAMAIAETDARLAFLNRGQDWVVRRLDALVPRVEDVRLRGDLAEMRAAHVENIRLTADFLAARSGGAEQPG